MCKAKFLCFIKQPNFVSSKRIDQLHNMFPRLSSSLNLGSRQCDQIKIAKCL